MVNVSSWFNDRSIATKIVATFGAVIAICACIAAVTFQSLWSIDTAEKWATHTYQVREVSKSIRIAVLREEIDARGYLLSHDASFLDRAHDEDAALKSALVTIGHLTMDNVSQQARLARLSPLIETWHRQLFAGLAEAARPGAASSYGAEGALGRVRSALSAIDAEEDRLLVQRSRSGADALASAYLVNILGPITAILTALLLGGALHQVVARPVSRLTAATHLIAEGLTDVVIPNMDRKDEIGAMSKALEVFRGNLVAAASLRAEREELQRKLKQDRAAFMEDLALRFETVVGNIVEAVTASALQMRTAAQSMLDLSESTAGEIKSVASATKQASTTMQAVNRETENVAGSFDAIDFQMSRSAESTRKAVAESDRAASSIASVSDLAKQIGLVTALINEVAQQINLLSLNAAIEAARAGEGGRGFAVVAMEIKTLANQAAQSADKIRRRIEAMQGAVVSSVEATTQIGVTIDELAQATIAVTQAVAEQGEATRDMRRQTDAAGQLASEVSSQLDQVSSSAVKTGAAARDVLSAAQNLAEQSSVLRAEARRFVGNVRVG